MFLSLQIPYTLPNNRRIMFRISAFLVLLAYIFTPNTSFAQSEHPHCISENHFHNNPKAVKDYQKKVAKITANVDRNNDGLGVITIPVVVHVVHNTAAENISDAQIQSQIDVLNAGFDLEAPWIQQFYPQAADVDIEFVLANRDPNGNTTNGITRTNTNVSIFTIDPAEPLDYPQNTYMKLPSQGGAAAWPHTDYLNIWVCNMQYLVKGFGSYPNTIATHLDGVVINYEYFGNIGTGTNYANYDLGKTCVHEVGHWLDLRHLFANADCAINDGIADTPAQVGVYYSCAAPINECGNSLMLENYMQYTYDQCQLVYTEGQKCVMRNNFTSGEWRESILSSNGYVTSDDASVTGNLWHDSNDNGNIDAGESMESNIQCLLYDCNQNLVATANTDSNGQYQFNNITPGNYYLIVNQNDLPSSRGVNPIWLTYSGCAPLAANIIYTQNIPLLSYATVSGEIWEDMNADAIQQSTDPMLSSIQVHLKTMNGSIIDQVSSDNNGNFQFSQVYPMDYYVEYMVSSNYLFTGSSPDNYAGNNYAPNTSPQMSLSQGQVVDNFDGGFYQEGNIGGAVWFDVDSDGFFDANESPAQNTRVELYDDNLQLIATAYTDNSGDYSFPDLTPDNYYLILDPPANYDIIPQSFPNYFDHSNGYNTSPFFSILSAYSINDVNAGLGFGTVDIQDVSLACELMVDEIQLSWEIVDAFEITQIDVLKLIDEKWVLIHRCFDACANVFIDRELIDGDNYYKLQAHKSSSDFTESEVVVVNYNRENSLSVSFNNPIQDILHLKIYGANEANLLAKIYNIDGREIKQFTGNLSSNSVLEKSIDFTDLSPGIYYLWLEMGPKVEVHKLFMVN